jgi:3-hydroxymyristoyl/3-hydroxydecanoyl-(acyl carrier protein) dehydratase
VLTWFFVVGVEIDSDGGVRAQVSTDADSAWFSGHFPGEPVLPGIAQLSMVVKSIEKALGKQLVLQQLARIKFKQLIRPGDVLDIHAVAAKNEDSYIFHIQNKEKEVCSGRLVLGVVTK